ncbi:MAG: hypothetical protein ACAH88_05310 [Roseimicrobium sp.]
MASGNTALKEQALSILQAGRREISAEARWLRHELNPKHAAERIARDHTGTVLLTAFGIGLLVPLLLIKGKHSRAEAELEEISDRQRKNLKQAKKPPKVGAGAYLAGLAMKAATPLLMKEGLRLWQTFEKARQNPSSSPAGY